MVCLYDIFLGIGLFKEDSWVWNEKIWRGWNLFGVSLIKVRDILMVGYFKKGIVI